MVINGESWGVYVNAQQFNKDFLGENFKTDRVPAGRCPAARAAAAASSTWATTRRTSALRDQNKDDAKAWASLIKLCKVLNETPPDKLEAELEPLLDIDGVLRFLALDVAWSTATATGPVRATTRSPGPNGRFHVMPTT